MTAVLTDSIQDYLKLIYELTTSSELAATTDLATRLGVAPASVTGMLQKLASVRPALVSYRKYQGVSLTGAGRRAALEVIRRHRLLEAWLVHSLGYSWDEVHREADKLEHVISGDFEKRMAAALGQPERDPHGEMIPTADLLLPPDASVPLASLQTGEGAIVRRVHAQDPALLRYLEELGLIPGTSLEVLETSPFDQVMRLQVHGRNKACFLGPAITQQVFIERL